MQAAGNVNRCRLSFDCCCTWPARWTPQDSIAVSIVASLELSDSWNDVVARDDIWRRENGRCFDALLPLSDSRYDVSMRGVERTTASRAVAADCGPASVAASARRPAIGSNAWAAGALRSADGNALIANDPHLDVTIPGIWYLVDVRSPHLHVAGATIPGIPGVVLGHNERVAWASTNAQAATTQVFRFDGGPANGHWTDERFAVRFAGDRIVRLYRTPREFSVPGQNGTPPLLVRWPVYSQAHSSIETMLALSAARNVRDGLRVLSGYRGSPQNFVLADRSGAIAYHVAGVIPNDPAWGRYVHPMRDAERTYGDVPFALLPSSGPARDGVVVSANNRSYAEHYRYRLSAQFEPPYRAYRIAQMLRMRRWYDPNYFSAMQLDTFSPIDAENRQKRRPARYAFDAAWKRRTRGVRHARALERTVRSGFARGSPRTRDSFLAGGWRPTARAAAGGTSVRWRRLEPWIYGRRFGVARRVGVRPARLGRCRFDSHRAPVGADAFWISEWRRVARLRQRGYDSLARAGLRPRFPCGVGHR